REYVSVDQSARGGSMITPSERGDLSIKYFMESNYERADNSNLPKIDPFMVALFFKNNADYYAAELKNVKTAVTFSLQESYGDDAVGYVQLYRDNGICTVKCKMCPEHKVRTKAYNVTLIVNENDGEIISCECHDCAASAGGCKHAVAFLMWVHRRSEEPACTSVECYWKKPALSRVGTTLKFITIEQMTKTLVPHRPSTSALCEDFILEAKKRKINKCELLKYQNDFVHSDITRYSLHSFMVNLPQETKNDVGLLLSVMKSAFTSDIIKNIEEATRQQNKTNFWYELRYGRITASKAHEVSVCHTTDGALVATIMGAKIPDTVAMKRGRILELSVQLQMYATGLHKCYFCIADSNFEHTQKVDIMLENYDEDFVNNLINKLTFFWKGNIYPILLRNTDIISVALLSESVIFDDDDVAVGTKGDEWPLSKQDISLSDLSSSSTIFFFTAFTAPDCDG
ncbi:hypothetical protein HW555_013722, partial [Spodoptera exigua]